MRLRKRRRWIEATMHDVTPTPAGLLHHTTCWCRAAERAIRDGHHDSTRPTTDDRIVAERPGPGRA